MAYCASCGKWFTPDNEHPYQKFCCTKHRKQFGNKKERGPDGSRTQKDRERAARKKIVCAICGEIFTPTRHHPKYCTDECTEKAARIAKDKASAKAKAKIKYCLYCGKPLPPRKSKYCPGCYFLAMFGRPEPKTHEKICEYCGKVYYIRYSKSRTCCDRHGKRLHKIERRIKKRTANHEPYSRFAIFQRDNFICHICGEPLNTDAVAPQWDSPTIDHVMALCNGGSDAPSNVKAAHFLCNSIKGSRW